MEHGFQIGDMVRVIKDSHLPPEDADESPYIGKIGKIIGDWTFTVSDGLVVAFEDTTQFDDPDEALGTDNYLQFEPAELQLVLIDERGGAVGVGDVGAWIYGDEEGGYAHFGVIEAIERTGKVTIKKPGGELVTFDAGSIWTADGTTEIYDD